MALTKTQLANLAISEIGAQPVDDVDAAALRGVKSAIEVNTHLEQVIAEVARSGRWNCLKRRATLDPSDDFPQFNEGVEFGWRNSYDLPEKCVRVIQLNGYCPNNDWNNEQYEIEGRQLLTNAGMARIQYIEANDCYGTWDSLFTNCVVSLLASKICFAVNQNKSAANAIFQKYEQVDLPKALQKNGGERRRFISDPALNSQFIASRRISTRG